MFFLLFLMFSSAFLKVFRIFPMVFIRPWVFYSFPWHFLGFSLFFLWFSYCFVVAFPMVFRWFFLICPMICLAFPLVFLWLSYGCSCFSYVSKCFSRGCPTVFLDFPCCSYCAVSLAFLGFPMV